MWNKPLPNIDPDNIPLYRGYKDHEFLLFRCEVCHEWYFPKSGCRHHENEPYLTNITLEPASGWGEVFAHTVTHYAFHPGFEDELPYVYALIELEEGPLYGSRIVDIDPAEVTPEMPVEVFYEDVPQEEIPPGDRQSFPFDDGFTLPYFVPSNGVTS